MVIAVALLGGPVAAGDGAGHHRGFGPEVGGEAGGEGEAGSQSDGGSAAGVGDGAAGQRQRRSAGHGQGGGLIRGDLAAGDGEGPAGEGDRALNLPGGGQGSPAGEAQPQSYASRGGVGNSPAGAVDKAPRHPQGVGAVDGDGPVVGQAVPQVGGAVHREAPLNPGGHAAVQGEGLAAVHRHVDADLQRIPGWVCARSHYHPLGGWAVQRLLDVHVGHRHGQGDGGRLRRDAGASAASGGGGAAVAAVVPASAAVLGAAAPHRVLGDAVVLGGQGLLHLPEGLRHGGLVALQLLLGAALVKVPQHVQAGVGVDFFAQGPVLHQLHQDKAVDVFLGVALADDVAPLPGLPLGIDHKFGHLAPLEHCGPALAGGRVGDAALHPPFQQIHLGVPGVEHFHPAAGAPNPHNHGGGADVQALLLVQGLADVEVEVAGVQQDLQLFPRLAHLSLAHLVQLDELAAVQVDPGVALLGGLGVIAVVKPHVFADRQGSAAAVGDRYAPLGFHQLDGGCGV